MGKLIKYELRKQRTSRMVIFISLAVALIGFWAGVLTQKDVLAAVFIAAMIFGAFLVLFYTGIESILVLNKDLRTKQSYMLWMLPKSVWEILGAKFISAFLQMLIVFVTAGIAVAVSIAAAIVRLGGVAELIDAIRQLSGVFIRGGVNWLDFINFSLVLFLFWALVIMTGFLSVILSRTLLIRSRFSGVLAVIIFFVINVVIERLYEFVYHFPSRVVLPAIGWKIGDIVFYVFVCLALFGISGLLADRKLSV